MRPNGVRTDGVLRWVVQVLKAERDLLHTSRFDLNIEHAYKYIMQVRPQTVSLSVPVILLVRPSMPSMPSLFRRLSNTFDLLQYVKQINGARDLAQVAWSFYNDR